MSKYKKPIHWNQLYLHIVTMNNWNFKLKNPRSVCCCCSVAQSCLTLCNSMDCSMPGFRSFTISITIIIYNNIKSLNKYLHINWKIKKKMFQICMRVFQIRLRIVERDTVFVVLKFHYCWEVNSLWINLCIQHNLNLNTSGHFGRSLQADSKIYMERQRN